MFKIYKVNVYYRHRRNKPIDATDFTELFTAESLQEFVIDELWFNGAEPHEDFTVDSIAEKLEAGKKNFCFEIDQDENDNGIIVKFSLT